LTIQWNEINRCKSWVKHKEKERWTLDLTRIVDSASLESTAWQSLRHR